MSSSESLIAAIRLRCPNCHKGNLFQKGFRMNQVCPECDYLFQFEPGVQLGSMYPNIAMTVVLATGVYWLLALWLEYDQKTVLWICLAFFILFPIWFHRIARSLWITFLHGIQEKP